jgi:hypothetical protein
MKKLAYKLGSLHAFKKLGTYLPYPSESDIGVMGDPEIPMDVRNRRLTQHLQSMSGAQLPNQDEYTRSSKKGWGTGLGLTGAVGGGLLGAGIGDAMRGRPGLGALIGAGTLGLGGLALGRHVGTKMGPIEHSSDVAEQARAKSLLEDPQGQSMELANYLQQLKEQRAEEEHSRAMEVASAPQTRYNVNYDVNRGYY